MAVPVSRGKQNMTNLFVGNLSFDTTDSDLQKTFGAFGSVERASVVRDRGTGDSRGFGFVEMLNPAEATDAMTALHGQDLNGQILNVNQAHSRMFNGGHVSGGYKRNSGGARA
jgi:cold-inducible RNA-binding protein